jgi:predicted alpha/beta-hydrolase family hydrolase
METLKIEVDPAQSVSGLLLNPQHARACFVFAHGAGAGMTHPFMQSVATGLCERGVATLRYQFPYMEKGAKRPDSPTMARATVRAAVEAARRLCGDLPMIAGGKSFGARMTSHAQATTPLPGVRGLAFLGFPLHPAGKPSDERGRHLSDIQIPMLFLQGTRDKLAKMPLLEQLTQVLGARASLQLFEHADHSFHAPARSGQNDRDIMRDMLDALTAWIGTLLQPSVQRPLT